MFKGKRYPSDKELYQDRIVNKMSTTAMGRKYGTPEKPVAEVTIINMLKRAGCWDGKNKTKIPKAVPLKENKDYSADEKRRIERETFFALNSPRRDRKIYHGLANIRHISSNYPKTLTFAIIEVKYVDS